MAPSTPQQHSQKLPPQPLSGAPLAVEDGPWDRESAEALTRAYEASEAEWQEALAGHQMHERAAICRPAPRAAPPPAELGHDGAWLEQRFAAIAERLQQSLAGDNALTSLAAMNSRLDGLEERFGAALTTVAQRSDVAGLRLMEAHIAELTTQFETLRAQLDRLDTIDGTLRDLAARLDHHAGPQPCAAVSEGALHDLLDSVSQRVAASLAAAHAPPSSQRLDALEELLHRYSDERRRGQEATASALRSIEETLSHIFDRHVAAGPEQADENMPPFLHHLARPRAVDDADRHALVEAYAEGARVLGHDALETVLDAADYAGAATGALRAPDPALPPLPVRADDGVSAPAEPRVHGQTHAELRASALRAMMQAQSMVLAHGPADQPRGAPQGGDREGGVGKRAHVLSGRPAGLSLLVALLLMFGAGYCAVNILLGEPSAAAPMAVVGPVSPTADQLPSPTAQQPALVPPAVDGMQGVRPAAAGDKADTADLPAWDGLIVAAFPATPVSLSSARSPAVEGAPLVDQDGPQGPSAEAVVPEAVTPAALREAAASGDPAAEFEVAIRLSDGRGVPRDPRQAFVWYQRAAMHGFVPAQFRLGGLYERGIGADMDVERAKIWYRRAAEQGHAMAMHNLAVVMVGKSMNRPDYAGAARWFREAAERGITDSQFNFGVLCQKGQGVPRDLAEAYKWFALAARSGDREAEQRKEQIKMQLAPAELKAAEETLAAWHSQPSDQSGAAQGRATQEERPAGG
jgi:localization factor PodJL